MTDRALVIKTYGNPEIAGAIVDGLSRRMIPLNVAELDAVKAELKRLQAREGTRQYRQRKDWDATCAELQRKYGVKPRGAVYDCFLIGYTLTYLTIVECCKRLSARIKRGKHRC